MNRLDRIRGCISEDNFDVAIRKLLYRKGFGGTADYLQISPSLLGELLHDECKQLEPDPEVAAWWIRLLSYLWGKLWS